MTTMIDSGVQLFWLNSTSVYTLDKVYTGLFTTINPPYEVMSTAIIPKFDSYNIRWNPVNTTDNFFMYMHFAEIEILKKKPDQRIQHLPEWKPLVWTFLTTKSHNNHYL